MFKGEDSGRAKLTEDQAREIKYGEKLLSQRLIGQKYGVSKSMVYYIRKSKYWKHI